MKLTGLTDTSVVVSGTSKDFSFGIEDEGMPVIVDIVSNRIYSDKKMAVIREYACNAKDANVENKRADMPIRITLPNRLEPVFKVRDFGKGLSNDEVEQIFVKYGTSTKRKSNKLIGMFGIGSKSGFAYGSAFVVSSFRDGKRSDFSAFKDNGMPRMSLLAEDDTTEPNGLEIQIPVRPDDIQEFHDKCRSFFSYWEIKPTFVGGEMKFSEEIPFLVGDNWKLFAYNSYTSFGNRAIAVMGQVPYVIDTAALNVNYGSNIEKLAGYPVILNFAIGDLNVNAGRESLEYDDKTKNVILTRLGEISKAIAVKVGEQFSGLTSMFASKKKFAEVFSPNSPISRMTSFVNKNELVFGNTPIVANSWGGFRKYLATNADMSFRVAIYSASSSYGKKRPNVDYAQSLVASDNVLYVINDEDAKHGIYNKVAPLLECEGTNPLNCLGKRYGTVYLITVEDKANYDKWVAKEVFDAPTVNISTLKKVKLQDIYGANCYDNTAALAAQKTQVFTLDFSCTSRKSHKRDYFQAADIDLKASKGLYVVIERYFIKVPPNSGVFSTALGGYYGSGVEPKQVIDMMNELNGLKFKRGQTKRCPVVYAVRERDVPLLGKDMKCFFKTIAPQFSIRILDKKVLKARQERCAAMILSREGSSFNFFKMNEKFLKGKLAEIFAKFHLLLNEDMSGKIQDVERLANRYRMPLENKNDDRSLLEAFEAEIARYPLLKMLNNSTYSPNATWEEIADYMAMIDKANAIASTP